ncbi:MAG: winged helix-turn-helix transcriptional regulator [Desulfuromonadales bacterium]|nr:winged helix-turn-helix transcriptional regulator [Desulfuromonadales bacterium]
MNDKSSGEQDSYRAFLLMNEIEKGESLSQRELAGRLGIALGLVNSYLKNLTTKGFVRIKNFPRNRYSYLLTPKGFTEKTRLAYQHLSYFNNLYTVVRQDYQALFSDLKKQGITDVVFCGVDEVAEIAYLSLQEVGLNLCAVVDEADQAETFFGCPVQAVDSLADSEPLVVLTSLKRRQALRDKLAAAGVAAERIVEVGK